MDNNNVNKIIAENRMIDNLIKDYDKTHKQYSSSHADVNGYKLF